MIAPEAQPGHARSLQNRHNRWRNVGRVSLDRELVSRPQSEPTADGRQQCVKFHWRQMRRRPAAEEERLDRPRGAERGQLTLDRHQVLARQVVPPRQNSEIAVAAMMLAEGDVNIGGIWSARAGACLPLGVPSGSRQGRNSASGGLGSVNLLVAGSTI